MSRAAEPPIKDQRAFQFAFWRAQRLAWVVFVILLALTALGLTGAGGPLSHATNQIEGSEIEHPRVGRWNAADEVRLSLAPGGAARTVVLSTAFADHFQIEDIQPAPTASIASAAGDRLVFAATPGEATRIVLHVRAQQPGLARYQVAVDGRATSLSSLILP